MTPACACEPPLFEGDASVPVAGLWLEDAAVSVDTCGLKVTVRLGFDPDPDAVRCEVCEDNRGERSCVGEAMLVRILWRTEVWMCQWTENVRPKEIRDLVAEPKRAVIFARDLPAVCISP